MPWYIPLVIFFARICDVSISTVRTMLMVQGYRGVSAFLGSIEVTIWVLAVGGVIKYLPNPWAVLGYAAGFGTGVLVGLVIEDRLAIGYRVVRVMSSTPGVNVSNALRAAGYGVTRLEATGRDGPVEVALLVVPRRAMNHLREVVQRVAPEAFVTIERADRPLGGVMKAGGQRRRSLIDYIRPMLDQK